MKRVICSNYKTCDNNGCLHKREHNHNTKGYQSENYTCFHCYYDNIDGSECVDVIKVFRKEKLIKINEKNQIQQI